MRAVERSEDDQADVDAVRYGRAEIWIAVT